MQVCPDADIHIMPLADGGEGSRDVLIAALHGAVRDGVGYFEVNGRPHAIIESAIWIGLHNEIKKLPVRQRGTVALGLIVHRLLDEGIRDIWLTLGGSATSDGGLGMLQALGCQAYDEKGDQVTPDLAGLMNVSMLDVTHLDPRLKACRMTVLVDVDNPLYGPRGAVYTYGQQKGLEVESMAPCDLAMQRWADVCEDLFRRKAASVPGAGAAGGLGFALFMLGASVEAGGDWILRHCGFDRFVGDCDWVITGEGRSDLQTLCGKLPLTVAASARRAGVKVALISGDVTEAAALSAVFDCVISARPQGVACPVTSDQASALLRVAASSWMMSQIVPIQS